MKAYNCSVRPAGQISLEVPKYGLSAKEVLLLRHVHGRDAVIKIEDIGQFKDYDEKKDLQNMSYNYGPAVLLRVFNVVVDAFDEEVDPKNYITNFEVIVAEAGKSASVKDIVAEAGATIDAPQNVAQAGNTTFIGNPDEQAAAKEVAGARME